MFQTLRKSAIAASAAFALMTSAGLAVVAQPVHAQAASESAAPATAPATPAVPSAAAKPATTTVDNPYGLEALWKTSDAIAKTVLVILLAMSMGSWYVIVVKLIEQTKITRQAKLANKTFWSAGTVLQGAASLEQVSPFRFIAEAGLESTKKHVGLLEHVDLNSWVTLSIQRAIERVQSRLQNGLALLATVGSTAPFVGLFGTVWGIYHALTAIGVAGQASIDKVAGPVGEALIMTAIGLAVAVPAVLGYNWLVRRNKGAMDEVRGFGNDLHSVLLATSRKA
ncbi:MotA/TolQ/ExbB proton channel family protein [Rhizobacter sp. Root1221]|uniref:MotA/TolQ/ExbB proton channel family protein n=1 Tax=Rhizobacter sp. Root1221 TaxID=1736433 RepID=UPI0006F6D6B9|nr:MotA/TolQ/ExbB proton channel family protein [Rhizobacter sp. Root1221]KQW00153.1 biopolymer transporter ExbB [Rhizobacter sp. Root1221]